MADLNISVDSVAPDVDMAEMQVEVDGPEVDGPEVADVDVADAEAVEGEGEAEAAEEVAETEEAEAEATEETAEEAAEETPKRTTFASYLSSPIVKLIVGGGETDESAETMELSAHKALLAKSPYFEKLFSEGEDLTISLPDQNLDAVGCFLEYLYTGDYFPRKLAGHAHALEQDPALPAVDETGVQLLKHARVYTLADTFSLPELQTLASSKIHCVQSTAQGEIAYARYVYASTRPDDTTVRHPVAKFWATRSHTLRAEAEKEFQSLCLQFPQFAYDVLTRVLDEKLKRERDDKMYPAPSPKLSQGSGRKRARQSTSVQ